MDAVDRAVGSCSPPVGAADPDDRSARPAAASLAAGYGLLEQQERDGAAGTTAEVAALIDPVIAFARAGLEALTPARDRGGSASARPSRSRPARNG